MEQIKGRSMYMQTYCNARVSRHVRAAQDSSTVLVHWAARVLDLRTAQRGHLIVVNAGLLRLPQPDELEETTVGHAQDVGPASARAARHQMRAVAQAMPRASARAGLLTRTLHTRGRRQSRSSWTATPA